jgi:hypothetical protein
MHNPAMIGDAVAPERRSREDVAKLAISGIVGAILAAQLLVGFAYHGGQAFPIVSYPMFSYAHHENDRLNDFLLYVSVDGGPEKVFDPEAMEISFPLFQTAVAKPIIRGEKKDVAAEIAREACAGGAAQSVAMNIFDSGYVITRDGPVTNGRKQMGGVVFNCSEF